MSRNKYKNNEPLNQRVQNQPDGAELDREDNNGNTISPVKKVRVEDKRKKPQDDEEEPVILSRWIDPMKEEPIPETIHPELYQIPIDYKDRVKLASTGPVDVTASQPGPGEEVYYPEADPRAGARSGEYMPHDTRLMQDDGTDETESMESRYYSEPINPYTGEKPYDEELAHSTGGPIDRRPIDRRPLKQKGFPWWWILLPLILLALIYGLTRPPASAQTQPATTAFFIPEISNLAISAASPESIYFTMV